jgi:protein-disulfide isomerase
MTFRERGKMKTLAFGSCLLGLLVGIAPAMSGVQTRDAAASVEARLPGYLTNYLSYDPASKVAVEKAVDRLPGFQGYKIKRTGKYPKLAVERLVYVSDDGKWFFDGDTLTNPNPKPVTSAADLGWMENRTASVYRTRVRASLAPERDAAGLKGVFIAVETGWGPVRVPGYVTPDGTRFFNGNLWDFQMDPREERKRRMDLSKSPFEGKPDGAVSIVEYADMECGYCRFRGNQMDALLEANAGALNYKRTYKFYPLWFNHVWSMKAASAADCIFRLSKPSAMFAFKKQVYSQQQALSVTGIDELAVNFAESAGIPSAEFRACYLRDESLVDVRKDLEEGQRLGVRSTPTYFVDGTEILWTEDKVMEDFLRTKAPGLKSIDYAPPAQGH